MTVFSKWMSPDYLASPIRGNEIGMKGPNGERVSVIIHHAFEKVRECVVEAIPHNPRYGPIRYKRMNYSDQEAIKLSHKIVPCHVEVGDIIGVAPNQVRDGERQRQLWLSVDQQEEWYRINFSSVFYWRKPESNDIKLTPGWAVIEIDQKTEETIGDLIILNQEYNKKPFIGRIRYVSEGEHGTKETIGVGVGDEVYFTPEMNVSMEINGEALFMIAHSQILAKKEDGHG